MKLVLAVGLLFSAPAFAAVNTSVAGGNTLLSGPSSARNAHFSTNLVGFSQGEGNAAIDFFLSDKITMGFRFESSSEKDKPVKKNGQMGNNKITIDRALFGIGPSFWLRGSEAKLNLVLNPFFAFGTKKDLVDVENQSGLGAKITGLVRVTRNVTAEVGVLGNNLETAEFRGDGYVGIGYLF